MKQAFLKDSLADAKCRQRGEVINFIFSISSIGILGGLGLRILVPFNLAYLFIGSVIIAIIVAIIKRSIFFKEEELIRYRLSYLQCQKKFYAGDTEVVQEIEKAMHELGYATERKFQKT